MDGRVRDFYVFVSVFLEVFKGGGVGEWTVTVTDL